MADVETLLFEPPMDISANSSYLAIELPDIDADNLVIIDRTRMETLFKTSVRGLSKVRCILPKSYATKNVLLVTTTNFNMQNNAKSVDGVKTLLW